MMSPYESKIEEKIEKILSVIFYMISILDCFQTSVDSSKRDLCSITIIKIWKYMNHWKKFNE